MENENVVRQGSQGDNLSEIKSWFENYKTQDSNGSTTKKKLTKEEIFAKFFRPGKEKEYFRILPPITTNGVKRKHFETAFFHPVKTNTVGGKKQWRKVYCLAHNEPKVPKLDANGKPVLDGNGKPILVARKCPLCEKADKILATQDQSIRGVKFEEMNDLQKQIKKNNDEIYKKAMYWSAKKFYITRGIDRGNTGDGIKFWRFKHNYKKQGVMDKLMPILQNFMEENNVDFADEKLGTDLIISVVDNKINGTDRKFKDVSTIFLKGQGPLSTDEIVSNQWVNDPTIWRDIFKPAQAPGLNSEEYMERIGNGVDPYWDDTDPNNKKWVFPDPNDAELQINANKRDNLGSINNQEKNVELASDIVNQSYMSNVTIENVTKQDVGQFNDDSEDIGNVTSGNENLSQEQSSENPVVQSSDDVPSYGDYDDLPF